MGGQNYPKKCLMAKNYIKECPKVAGGLGVMEFVCFLLLSLLMRCSKMGLLCNQTKHIQYLETAPCRAILLLRWQKMNIRSFGFEVFLSFVLKTNLGKNCGFS